MNQQEKNLVSPSPLKTLIKIAVPIVFSNILQSAYQLTDAFWVGKLGENAIAAVSVTFPITFLSIALGTGFSLAGSTLISQYFGAKNTKMVNHVASQTILMNVIISIILSILGFSITPLILSAMNVAPEVTEGAQSFMRISFIGLTPVFFFFVFQSILRGISEVKLPMYIVLGTVLLNFILDPFFIYGIGPIPALGVSGAALATLFTQTIASVIGMELLLSGKLGVRLNFSDLKPDIPFIKKAFKIGLPGSIEMSARALSLAVMAGLITSFGTTAIAGYGVGSTILQLIIIPAMGLSIATSALIGQNIGANQIKNAVKIGNLSSFINFAVLTFIGLIVYIFAYQFIGFFIPDDAKVIETGVEYIRIMAPTFGLLGLQLNLIGVFRGSGNMLTTMILTLVSQWIITFPAAYILSKYTSLGLDGIWWAFPVSNIATAIITLIIYSTGKWQNKRLTQEIKQTEKATEEIITEEGIRT